MKWFRNQTQLKVERDLQIRQGLMHIRRNIKSLERNVRDYRGKAVRATQIGSEDQLQVIKKAIARSLGQIRMQKRQLLAIEIALQMKDQAESMTGFATALQAVSSSMAEVFVGNDMEASIANYQRAVAQGADMEARMEILLEMNAEMVQEPGSEASEASMQEVERLIKEDVRIDELNRVDSRLDAELIKTPQSV